MYLSSKQILDIVIYMLDTKLAYMLVDGFDNPGELDSVKRCRLALRTARAANGGQDRLHRSRPMNGEVPLAFTDLAPLIGMRAIATANPVRHLGYQRGEIRAPRRRDRPAQAPAREHIAHQTDPVLKRTVFGFPSIQP